MVSVCSFNLRISYCECGCTSFHLVKSYSSFFFCEYCIFFYRVVDQCLLYFETLYIIRKFLFLEHQIYPFSYSEVYNSYFKKNSLAGSGLGRGGKCGNKTSLKMVVIIQLPWP